MSKDLVEKIKAVATVDETTRLSIYYNAKVNTLKSYNAEPTAVRQRDMVAAEKNFEGYAQGLIEKYFPEESADAEDSETFKTKKQVLSYLQQIGWQISQSQFYAHCKSGLLRPGSDGLYIKKAIDKYAKTWLKQLATGQKVNERLDRMQEEKLEVDLRASKFKMEEAEFNLGIRKSKFVAREDFELAIVGRAVAFMAHLNHTVQAEAADWIDIVGGDQARAPELVAAISRAIEQRMGDFAADAEFDVILEAN